MNRLTAIVCTATLAVTALAGCGSDGNDTNSASDSSGGSYCDQVKDAQSELKSSSDPNATIDDLNKQAESMKAVADAAPDDVADSWSNLADFQEKSIGALEDAGLDTDKPLKTVMAKAQKDPKLVKKIQASMPEQPTSLQSDNAAILKETKDECNIDLAGGTAQ